MNNNTTPQKPTNRMRRFRQQNKDVPVSNQNVELLDKLRPVYAAELGMVKLSRSGLVNHLIERAADAKLGLSIAAANDKAQAASEAKTGGAAQAPQAQAPVTGDAEDNASEAVTGNAVAVGNAVEPVTRNTPNSEPADSTPSGKGDGGDNPSQNVIKFEGGEIVADKAVISVFFKMPDDRRFVPKAVGFGYDPSVESWSRKFSSEELCAQVLPVLTRYLQAPSPESAKQLIRAANVH